MDTAGKCVELCILYANNPGYLYKAESKKEEANIA